MLNVKEHHIILLSISLYVLLIFSIIYYKDNKEISASNYRHVVICYKESPSIIEAMEDGKITQRELHLFYKKLQKEREESYNKDSLKTILEKSY